MNSFIMEFGSALIPMWQSLLPEVPMNIYGDKYIRLFENISRLQGAQNAFTNDQKTVTHVMAKLTNLIAISP